MAEEEGIKSGPVIPLHLYPKNCPLPFKLPIDAVILGGR